MKNKWQMFVAGALLTTVMVAPTVEASTYTVQKGDTLTKIAKAHNTTIQQLKQLNSLENDGIYVQQLLRVANLKTQVVTKPNVVQVEKPVAKQTPHKVVKGDTLSKIAKQYQTTIATIKQLNTLSSDDIKVGQNLIVTPSSSVLKGELLVGGQTSNESIGVEKVEAVIEFVASEVKQTEQLITRQLASEKLIVSGPSVTGQATYNQVITVAKELLGMPYMFGGNTISGFDCSGFVNYVYKTAGVEITRKSSLDYFLQGTTQVKQPVPGDLVFFKNTYISTISHMGIYIGNNEFIHAGSNGIEISKLSVNYWNERFVAFKRLAAI